PRTSDRTEAKIKEVSPCSEYTRYTVEGILKYPMSGRSAVLDVHAMGPLFMNSCIRDARWSDRLGYGMGVIGEDTRVHLHGNGKFVIRRAADREHAERSYLTLVTLIKPMLYSIEHRRYLWDAIRESATTGGGIIEEMGPFLTWPDGTSDPSEVLNGAKEGMRDAADELLSPVRDLFLKWLDSGTGQDPEEVVRGCRNMVEEAMGKYLVFPLEDANIFLGRASIAIWAVRALEEIRYIWSKVPDPFLIYDIVGKDPWHEGERDWHMIRERTASEGATVSLARLHYLLGDVMA
ncbi:MAG: hypothetical protein ACMUHY_08690, partial [Thermoplasmatota archaeon]